MGCFGNGVIGGVSADMDPNGETTSVAPALRKSVMALTCYISWLGGSL